MSGANCAIFVCSKPRKHKIAIFEVPTKDDEYNTDRRRTVIDFNTTDRVVDKSLKKLRKQSI